MDKRTKEVSEDFVVFNVMGLVPCATLDQPNKLPLGGGFYFQNLAIDPEKTNGLLVFRLAGSLMDIIVSEDVAKKLEENDIRALH